MNSVLVIGGGIAGQAVCEAVRERDPDVAITLVCGEPHKPYDRVRLGTLLAEDGDVEALRLRPDSWYEDAHIEVRTGVRVAALDPAAGTATLNDMHETVLSFDRAVLCTGSDALVPPMQNQDATGVHVFRDPADCEAILGAARLTASRAAVIGGGLLGLEAAYALAQVGCPTTVIHLVDRLMERQLDAPASALLRPAIEGLGVDVRLEHATRAIRSDVDGNVTGLLFADGSELDCDLVVVAVGIRPHVGLARATGLEVDRGIVVDDAMVTSAPNVLAVGECAQHRGVVHGIVAPIHDQARVAGQTITGATATYTGSIPTAKLKVMGIDLVTAGAAEGDREVVVADAAEGTYRKLVTAPDGTVRGAVLVGDARGAELLIEAVRTERVTEDALALLAEASQATAAELPDAAQVCNCNGVCKGTIVEAIRERGLGSTQEVVNVTRAGAGCGSCKPVVTELLTIERAGAAEEPAYLCPCRRQTREELAAVVREQEITSVSELSQACGAGRDCGACKPGLSYLIEERQAGKFRQERHAKFINDRVHANIQNDGTFSVVPRIRGGVVTADELRRFADVADKYELPMIKITGGQRIDLLGATKEQLPAIWEDLGMPSGYAYSKAVRTVKTCVGTDLLPLRPRRLDQRRHRPRALDGGPAHAAQGQGRGDRLPAQLRGGVRQGHRRGRRRGRLGGLRRRRGRCQRAQGRPAREGADPRGGQARRARLPAVLPRARRPPGADVRLPGARRTRDRSGRGPRSRQAGGAARALRDREGRLRPRSVARAGDARASQAVRRARHRAGVRPRCDGSGGAVIVSTWINVGRAEDVPMLEGRTVTVESRRVAIFRLPDGWAAIDAMCPHKGGPLQDGLVADRCVTCPLHNRRFDLHTGRQQGGEDRVAVHEIDERGGELWIAVS